MKSQHTAATPETAHVITKMQHKEALCMVLGLLIRLRPLTHLSSNQVGELSKKLKVNRNYLITYEKHANVK